MWRHPKHNLGSLLGDLKCKHPTPPPLSFSLCTGTGSQGFLKSKNLAIICQEKKKTAAGLRWLPPPRGPYFRYALTLGPYSGSLTYIELFLRLCRRQEAGGGRADGPTCHRFVLLRNCASCLPPNFMLIPARRSSHPPVMS
jgi:hypothetical protein